MKNLPFLPTLLFATAILAPHATHAWGEEGHRVVALLALSHLTPTAKAEVDRLLALESGATLMVLSTWADAHREFPTSAWHFVNLPDDCTYRPERDCAGGHCAIEAIQRQTQRLKRGATAADRLLALKYVVHFVADIHQPLHAGLAADKGGSTHQLQAFGQGTNMHAFWDFGLIDQRSDRAVPLIDSLAGLPPPRRTARPLDWAQESCRVVHTPGFYPAAGLLDADYVQRWEPLVRQRLSDAAYRLAWTLNAAFPVNTP